MSLEKGSTVKFTYKAIEAAGLGWEVHLEPVYLERDRWRHPDTLGENRWRDLDTGDLGTRVTKHRTVVRSNDGYPLGIVGRHYVPIQNNEMFEFADKFRTLMSQKTEEGGAGILAATKPKVIALAEIDEGRRVYVVLELPVSSDAIEPNDDLTRFFVTMVTSHDGSAAFRIGLVPTWMASTDPFRLGLVNYSPIVWTIRHTKAAGLLSKDLKGFVEEIPGYLNNFIILRDQMSKKKVSDEAFKSFLEKLIPIPKKALKRTESIRLRYRKEIQKAYVDSTNKVPRGSRWGVVNAVAAWEQWAKPVRNVKPEDRTEWLLTSLVKGRGTEYLNRALVLLAPKQDGAWPSL